MKRTSKIQIGPKESEGNTQSNIATNVQKAKESQHLSTNVSNYNFSLTLKTIHESIRSQGAKRKVIKDLKISPLVLNQYLIKFGTNFKELESLKRKEAPTRFPGTYDKSPTRIAIEEFSLDEIRKVIYKSSNLKEAAELFCVDAEQLEVYLSRKDSSYTQLKNIQTTEQVQISPYSPDTAEIDNLNLEETDDESSPSEQQVSLGGSAEDSPSNNIVDSGEIIIGSELNLAKIHKTILEQKTLAKTADTLGIHQSRLIRSLIYLGVGFEELKQIPINRLMKLSIYQRPLTHLQIKDLSLEMVHKVIMDYSNNTTVATLFSTTLSYLNKLLDKLDTTIDELRVTDFRTALSTFADYKKTFAEMELCDETRPFSLKKIHKAILQSKNVSQAANKLKIDELTFRKYLVQFDAITFKELKETSEKKAATTLANYHRAPVKHEFEDFTPEDIYKVIQYHVEQSSVRAARMLATTPGKLEEFLTKHNTSFKHLKTLSSKQAKTLFPRYTEALKIESIRKLEAERAELSLLLNRISKEERPATGPIGNYRFSLRQIHQAIVATTTRSLAAKHLGISLYVFNGHLLRFKEGINYKKLKNLALEDGPETFQDEYDRFPYRFKLCQYSLRELHKLIKSQSKASTTAHLFNMSATPFKAHFPLYYDITYEELQDLDFEDAEERFQEEYEELKPEIQLKKRTGINPRRKPQSVDSNIYKLSEVHQVILKSKSCEAAAVSLGISAMELKQYLCKFLFHFDSLKKFNVEQGIHLAGYNEQPWRKDLSDYTIEDLHQFFPPDMSIEKAAKLLSTSPLSLRKYLQSLNIDFEALKKMSAEEVRQKSADLKSLSNFCSETEEEEEIRPSAKRKESNSSQTVSISNTRKRKSIAVESDKEKRPNKRIRTSQAKKTTLSRHEDEEETARAQAESSKSKKTSKQRSSSIRRKDKEGDKNKERTTTRVTRSKTSKAAPPSRFEDEEEEIITPLKKPKQKRSSRTPRSATARARKEKDENNKIEKKLSATRALASKTKKAASYSCSEDLEEEHRSNRAPKSNSRKANKNSPLSSNSRKRKSRGLADSKTKKQRTKKSKTDSGHRATDKKISSRKQPAKTKTTKATSRRSTIRNSLLGSEIGYPQPPELDLESNEFEGNLAPLQDLPSESALTHSLETPVDSNRETETTSEEMMLGDDVVQIPSEVSSFNASSNRYSMFHLTTLSLSPPQIEQAPIGLDIDNEAALSVTHSQLFLENPNIDVFEDEYQFALAMLKMPGS